MVSQPDAYRDPTAAGNGAPNPSAGMRDDRRRARALWKDFTGEGPKSGMWWHGDLDQVAQAMDADEPPADERALLKLLQLSQVTVRKRVHGSERPVVELSFHAPFEEEHGVGLLTDGEEILGIGYSSDVTPFKPAKKPQAGSNI